MENILLTIGLNVSLVVFGIAALGVLALLLYHVGRVIFVLYALSRFEDQ